MVDVLSPTNPEQVREAVAWAAATKTPLEVTGAGTRRGLGRPLDMDHQLDLSGLTGVTLYEPGELVMSALAGTPVAEIERQLLENGQRLAFEPGDYGPLFGAASGKATIGGVFAGNISGPGRIRAGAARDHLLGLKMVNGRGEAIFSGGRVVKNVTGYDMCKLLAGSYGTLAVMTELTFKVMPMAETARTVFLSGLDDETALAAMTEALKSEVEVSAAAHLPSGIPSGGMTALRVEGPASSVAERCCTLSALLADFGKSDELVATDCDAFWRNVRDVTPFLPDGGPSASGKGPENLLWRISLPPSEAPGLIRDVREKFSCRIFYDWGGGLVWLAPDAPPLEGDGGAAIIRRLLEVRGDHMGGQAMLFRGSHALRAGIPVFQPQPASLAALTARVKESFDPLRIFNPGRMYEGV
jgi:glycolate oxidase FAD binding subunit